MILYDVLKHWDKLKVSPEESKALKASAIFIHNVKRLADRFQDGSRTFPSCVIGSDWHTYVDSGILYAALQLVQGPNGECCTTVPQIAVTYHDKLARSINNYDGESEDYTLGVAGTYHWILVNMMRAGLILNSSSNHDDDKLGILGQSVARFIGRMNSIIEGKNIDSVMGDSKTIKLSHYIGAVKNMFDLNSLDLGTAIEAMTLSVQLSDEIVWTLYPNSMITDGYSACTYKSCMNNDNGNQGKKALLFYEALGDVELLTGSKGGKTHSRALLWKLPNGTYLMDRIYDYQEQIGMYDIMDNLIKSKRDNGILNVVRHATNEKLSIKIVDMRRGKGQADNHGFVKNVDKVYISVQHLVKPLPMLEQCPYYDTVIGAKVPRLYSKTITLMIGRDVTRVKELLFKNGGKKKYRDIHGYSKEFYPLWFFQGRSGGYVTDPADLYIVNNSFMDISDKIITIKNGVICQSSSSQDVELKYKSTWITNMMNDIQITTYNGEAISDMERASIMSKIKILVDIDETVYCSSIKRQIHLSDACLVRIPMDAAGTKDILHTVLRASGTPFKSMVVLKESDDVLGYEELCPLYRVAGNLASAVPVFAESSLILATPEGNVLSGDFRLGDNGELIVTDLQFKAIGQ